MTAELTTLQVRSRRHWRAWLATHHTSSPGVWLVFYKAHTGVGGLLASAGLAATPTNNTYRHDR